MRNECLVDAELIEWIASEIIEKEDEFQQLC
jgi:hypothetical protein